MKRDYLLPRRRAPLRARLEELTVEIAEKHAITLRELLNGGRKHYLVLARQELFYEAARVAAARRMGLEHVADILGYDRTNVRHGKRAHARRIADEAGNIDCRCGSCGKPLHAACAQGSAMS